MRAFGTIDLRVTHTRKCGSNPLVDQFFFIAPSRPAHNLFSYRSAGSRLSITGLNKSVYIVCLLLLA